MDLVVGRVVRAHGVSGELVVEVRTDDPDSRFAESAQTLSDSDEVTPEESACASRWIICSMIL